MFWGMNDIDFAQILGNFPKCFGKLLKILDKLTQILPKLPNLTQILHKYAQILAKKNLLKDAVASSASSVPTALIYCIYNSK